MSDKIDNDKVNNEKMNNKVTNSNIINNNKTKNNTFEGMPGLVFLPSHMYKFKIVTDNCLLSVPISGKFSEMYPDFFEEVKKDKMIDKFEVVSDKSGIKYLFSVSLIEVLFAESKYPALEKDEIFAISSMFLSKETLYISGAVLKLI